MFTNNNIHYLLALFILCNIVNLVLILLLKTNILSFINNIFSSEYNRHLNWYADSKLLFKSLVMMTICFMVVVLLLVQYVPSVAKCLNQLKYVLSNNGIVDFNKIPLALWGCIGTAYLIFGITIISCTKLNFLDTIKNIDIMGTGHSVETFVTGKREGYTSFNSQKKNYKNQNGIYMNEHRNIRYNNLLSKYIKKTGSIFFGVGLESKPECCNNNKYTSSGCLCVNQDNINNIQQRGNNHKLGETFLNSFVDLKRTMVDANTEDRISMENSFDTLGNMSGDTQASKAAANAVDEGTENIGFNTTSAPTSLDMEITHGDTGMSGKSISMLHHTKDFADWDNLE